MTVRHFESVVNAKKTATRDTNTVSCSILRQLPKWNTYKSSITKSQTVPEINIGQCKVNEHYGPTKTRDGSRQQQQQQRQQNVESRAFLKPRTGAFNKKLLIE